jgi:hypothetical protein
LRTIKESLPIQTSLSRRDFLKLVFVSGSVGIPVGFGYYLFAQLRSFIRLSETLQEYTIETIPAQPAGEPGSSTPNKWNQGEISAISPEAAIIQKPTGLDQADDGLINKQDLPRVVDGLILGDGHYDFINLADNRRNMILIIITNKNRVIPTSRAAPHAYSRKAVKNDLFRFDKFTTLSFNAVDDNGAACTLAHSGISTDGRRLFADFLERSIRLDPGGRTRTAKESIKFIKKELLGASALLLQEKKKGVLPFTIPNGFRLKDFKRGNVLQLKITAAARVEYKAIDDYEANINGTGAWMRKEPRKVWGDGWENFEGENHWILRTCLGTSADDPSLFDISRNRLVLAMKPIQGMREPAFDPRV